MARSPFNRVKICWSDGRWDSSQWLWFDAIYCLHVGFETLPLLLFSSHVFKPVFLRCWLHLANSTGHPKWISMDKLYYASLDQHRNKQIVFADIVPVICNQDEHTVRPGSQTAKSKLVGCNDIEYRHAHIPITSSNNITLVRTYNECSDCLDYIICTRGQKMLQLQCRLRFK